MKVWTYDIWNSHKRDWTQEVDTDCIRSAFSTLRNDATRWPPMAKFWIALPDRAEKRESALPEKIFTEEERMANIDRVYREAMEALGVPVKEKTA